MTSRQIPSFRRFFPRAAAAGLILLLGPLLRAADPAPKSFDIPADIAENSLKEFSAQSGLEVVFATAQVGRTPTNAVKGDYLPREAINLLLSGTGLVAQEDRKTGAFLVTTGPTSGAASGASYPLNPSTRAGTQASNPIGAVVNLDPFEVQASADKGYAALNSNSITAFNVALEKLPVSADIFDQTFMSDTAATSVESLITGYSAGAGTTSPDPSSASVAASNQPGDRVSHGTLSIRGLPTAYSLRDGLLPNGNPTEPGSTGVGFTSTFDVERAEVIYGPQALLYGSTGGGGVVNIVSKQAQVGAPSMESLTYQIDQFGSKMALLDYGTSAGDVAIRLAVLGQTIDTQRINIGGPLTGYYLQLAANVFKNTTVRVEGEQTTYNRILAPSLTLDASSTANDSRNGDYLTYLLATNQVQQAASGPNGAGVIDNGYLNWSNVNSFEGWYDGENTVDNYEMLSVDTHWSDWLSTTLQAGYTDWEDEVITNSGDFYSPTATSNPLPGNWTFSDDATQPELNEEQGSRTQAVRFLVLATNDLFGGKDNSRSMLGVDMLSNRTWSIDYGLFEADSNWNIISNPSVTTLNKDGTPGATAIPTLNWTVNQGPIFYPFFQPNATRVTFNGVNYVRAMENPVNPQLISPGDPEGVTLGGDENETGKLITKAVSGTNYTDWLGGKLTTLVGFRLEQTFDEEFTAGSAPPSPPLSTVLTQGTGLNYNVGADYHLTNLLSPYFSISSSYAKPETLGHGVFGDTPQFSRSIGQEAGIKLQNEDGTISGSLAAYHVNSTNEQLEISSTLEDDINPSGLNGVVAGRGSYVNVDRESEGVQLTLVAAPTGNWRMRLSAGWNDGTIGTNASLPQIYNDQFNENSQGDVTYANGAIVYVAGNATGSTTAKEVSSTTAGAVPLTVQLMSNSSSVYYANPVAVTGAISASSNVGKILKSPLFSATNGSILTGATGLPISDIQINPGFALPGTFVVAQAGDATTGYPELSTSFTNVYTFSSGWARGIEVGGSVNLGWLYRDFYYYPDNYTGPASPRNIFSLPIESSFNLIAGYIHKFRRVTFHSQLNVSNMFNHYSVILIPGEITGWTNSTGIQATLSQPPRYYQWTNEIRF